MLTINKYLSQLLDLKPTGEKIYLVGGAVRDILLQKPGKDYDLVCSFDTRLAARKFADQMGGAFFMLDNGRNTSRVILYNGEKIRMVFDFAHMQGKSIHEDLALRDFTINAMAIDLEEPDRLIDPMAGANDLNQKILRICTQNSFQDDPVRVIRAVRYAVDLGLHIETGTLTQLKKAVPLLPCISLERRRDEFLKIIESAHPDLGLRLCGQMGILRELGLSGTRIDETAISHLRCFHQLLTALEGVGKNDSAQELVTTSFLLQVGRYRERLIQYMHEMNPSGRTRRTLDLLASMLQHLNSSEYSYALQQLSLSKEEGEFLSHLYENQQWIREWKAIPDRRKLYHFFQNTTVDQVLLWLAEQLTVPAAERSQEQWLQSAAICERVVRAWADEMHLLNPKPLLSGKDLMMQFDMAPGPELGRLLDSLVEEQAAGTIQTKEDALRWAEAHQETDNHW